MAELLTKNIAREYQKRVSRLPDKSLQDIGERRKLRIDLQERCGLSELQAINVLNNRFVDDYIAIQKREEYMKCDTAKRSRYARE